MHMYHNNHTIMLQPFDEAILLRMVQIYMMCGGYSI